MEPSLVCIAVRAGHIAGLHNIERQRRDRRQLARLDASRWHVGVQLCERVRFAAVERGKCVLIEVKSSEPGTTSTAGCGPANRRYQGCSLGCTVVTSWSLAREPAHFARRGGHDPRDVPAHWAELCKRVIA